MRTGLRIIAACAAFAAAAAIWMSPYARDAGGSPNGLFALGLSAAIAILVAGWTASTLWARPGAWLALAIAGQASALQLMDAGIRIHYQHYRLPGEALSNPVLRWMLLVAAIQSLVVGAGLFSRRDAILQWCRQPYRLLLLAAGVAVCGSVAAAVSRDPRYYVAEVSLGAFLQIINAGNILLAVWALPTEGLKLLGRRFDSLLGDAKTERTSIDRFVLLAGLWVVVVSSLLAWFSYQRHPHVADEVAYLYQARYFAAGKFTMDSPPVQQAFEVDLMEYKPGRWYAATPLGWPAVLAIGAAIGAPWLINPLLAGFNILLSYLFVGELYPRRTARIVVLLLCLSPWHVFMAMSYMNHTLNLTCALLAVLGVARARRTGSLGWALIAGVGVGIESSIRPLECLIMGILTAAWAIGIGGKRLRFPALAALAVGTVLSGSVTMVYNKLLIGDATASTLMQFASEHYGRGSNAYGFGPDRGMGWPTDAYPGHTPFESLINDELNASSLNVELFGWSAGSLALIALLILSGGLRRQDYRMIVVIALVIAAYMPYWGNGGGDFGARYWYLILLPCILLTARGLERLEGALRSESRGEVRATAAVAALCAMALVNYFPWRSFDKYFHYLRMRPDVRTLAREHDFGRSLVLIRGENFPDYASAAIYNPIDLNADAPVYAWDRNPAVRAEVLKVYSGRPVWVLEGPSITGAGYRIAAGPLNASTAR